MGKRISIINFKGGVGKTTLAFNVAAGLARFHNARVLLIDMDHQSSLSVVCLGTDAWEHAAHCGKTVNEIFRHFPGSGLPGRDIIHQSKFGSHDSYKNVQVVPANLDLDDTEIELTASHQGNAIASEWNKRTLMCYWIEQTGIDDEYDYILFDCAPATKIITQNALAASHGYIVPVVPEAVMERGAPHLCNMIRSGIDKQLKALAAAAMDQPRSKYVPETHLLGLIVTRIQTSGNALSGYTNDHTSHLRSLKTQWGSQLLAPYIAQGTGVSEALTASVPVFDRADTRNIGDRHIDKQYEDLTNKLRRRIEEL